MKNSLAALLADDKARVYPEEHRCRQWTYTIELNFADGSFVSFTPSADTFPTRSEAELAGEALRDKAKEQVNR